LDRGVGDEVVAGYLMSGDAEGGKRGEVERCHCDWMKMMILYTILY
jgi:hypothetical protein